MRVLLDTNVVLDFLLAREPWNDDARRIWLAQVQGGLEAFVTSTSITDVFYIARRQSDVERARNAVRACIDQLFVISVGTAELSAAFALDGSDFEDDLQIACALASHVDAIVTRDPSGYRGATVEVLSPQELVDRFA